MGKPTSREKKTFTSSIECLKKATEEEEERQEMKMKMERPALLRKTSYTSSLDNIAIGGEDQKQVHLICFSKENSGSTSEVADNNKPPLLRKMSFTSSLDNIAIGREEREKVHLSCFSKEMGSNVDLVQVCQEQEEGKHEVKLEFKIEENDVKESEKPIEQKEKRNQLEEDLTE